MTPAELTSHELIQRYGSLFKTINRIPRSVDEIYRAWTGWDRPSLNRRRRNERRWCAKALEIMARKGLICRGVLLEDGRRWVAFWRPEPHHTTAPTQWERAKAFDSNR